MMDDRRWQAWMIFTGILVLSLLLWVIPAQEVEILNFLHHLSFIPLLFAGMLLGGRAALISTAFAALTQAPYIWLTLQLSSLNALDQVVELSIFGVAGVVAGFLSDRERRQREKLEKATTELEGVYQELSQNVEKLKKAERLFAAGQLSASVAHEIRNPLASISGAAALLKRANPTSNNFVDCLEIIEKESQRLNKLLSNFLDFASPKAPRFQPTDVAAVIQSVASQVAHMTGGEIELRRHVPQNLPETDCDPEQLKQVLLNLVINAVQASQGKGVIELGASAADERISITVRDQGCGLGPVQRDRIFDPFFTTKENGTGLGLAIAAKIVEQHGGQLSAENNADKGATFRLELPLRQGVRT
jgi:signal transduction histidine kinase